MATEPTFDIIVIRKTLDEVQRQVTAIETDISTINEAINSHARNGAVFAYRHDQAKQISDKLSELVERMNERGEDELHKTIEMIDKREVRLAETISAHKEIVLREVALQHQTLNQAIAMLQKTVDQMVNDSKAAGKELEGVKKWLWTLAGGLVMLSLLADKIWALIQG